MKNLVLEIFSKRRFIMKKNVSTSRLIPCFLLQYCNVNLFTLLRPPLNQIRVRHHLWLTSWPIVQVRKNACLIMGLEYTRFDNLKHEIKANHVLRTVLNILVSYPLLLQAPHEIGFKDSDLELFQLYQCGRREVGNFYIIKFIYKTSIFNISCCPKNIHK